MPSGAVGPRRRGRKIRVSRLARGWRAGPPASLGLDRTPFPDPEEGTRRWALGRHRRPRSRPRHGVSGFVIEWRLRVDLLHQVPRRGVRHGCRAASCRGRAEVTIVPGFLERDTGTVGLSRWSTASWTAAEPSGLARGSTPALGAADRPDATLSRADDPPAVLRSATARGSDANFDDPFFFTRVPHLLDADADPPAGVVDPSKVASRPAVRADDGPGRPRHSALCRGRIAGTAGSWGLSVGHPHGLARRSPSRHARVQLIRGPMATSSPRSTPAPA